MSMPEPVYYSRAMLRDIPEDGNRYEVVRGELLVTPAPRLWHEEVVHRLFIALRAYADGVPTLHVVGSRSEVSWGDPDTELQPDVFVVPKAQARTLDWEKLTNLLLVVEVLSPSSRRHDRFTKRHEYQRRRVPVYWIVDPEEQRVEIWGPDDHFPVFERERLVWRPEGVVPGFTLELQALFRPI